MSNIISEKTLIQVDPAKNNNKFYKVTIAEVSNNNYVMENNWGRVGARGQSKQQTFTSISAAKAAMNKILREKQAKGYTEVDNVSDTIRVDSSANQQALKDTFVNQIADKGDAATAALVAELHDQNIHTILKGTSITFDKDNNVFRTPLGVIGLTTIDKAQSILTDIKSYLSDKKNQGADRLAAQYLTLIPNNIGRNKPTMQNVFPDDGSWQGQWDICEALKSSIEHMNQKAATAVKVSQGNIDLNIKLNPVSDSELEMLKALYEKTKDKSHKSSVLSLTKAWKINKNGNFKNVGNIKKLWHGSMTKNVLSILTNGFKIPPRNASHCTGRMFGDGLYFAPKATKSLNYAYGYWSGSKSEKCYMFLCEVSIGKSYTPDRHSTRYPVLGYDSVWAKKGKSGVINDEIIVYDVDQAKMLYLCEFGNP